MTARSEAGSSTQLPPLAIANLPTEPSKTRLLLYSYDTRFLPTLVIS